MDALHAKAAADLHLRSTLAEDEFYNRLSCDWIQTIRTMFRKISLVRRQRCIVNFARRKIWSPSHE
jgi:hypothetical protein